MYIGSVNRNVTEDRAKIDFPLLFGISGFPPIILKRLFAIKEATAITKALLTIDVIKKRLNA